MSGEFGEHGYTARPVLCGPGRLVGQRPLGVLDSHPDALLRANGWLLLDEGPTPEEVA